MSQTKTGIPRQVRNEENIYLSDCEFYER